MDDAGGFVLTSELPSGEAADPCPSATPSPSFHRADWESFGVTAALSFVVYLFTISPSIELTDSGIFTTGAMYAGVPDTPGFPLWTLYAHLFTVLLPVSNMAWRVSVSSAFAAAVACGLIALMVSRVGALILEDLRSLPRLAPQQEKWLRIVAGYAAGMSFGLSSSVWSHAVIPIWWPLTFALLAAILCLLLRWSQTPEKTRYLYAAIFLYGLTLTNSQSLIVAALGLEILVLIRDPVLGRDLFALTGFLFIPVLFAAHYSSVAPSLWRIYLATAALCFLIACCLIIKTRAVFTSWKTVFFFFLFFVFGLSLYLYAPIASMTNPPMNWNYPRVAEGFRHLVFRGQYEALYPVDDFRRYWEQIRLYYGIVSSDYGWLYLFPAVIPFFFLHRLRAVLRYYLLGLCALFLCVSFFLLAGLNPSSDRASREMHKIYFAPSYLLLAIFVGLGLILLGALSLRKKPPFAMIATAL